METKNFLEIHQDSLSPDEKLIILKEYINLWVDIKGFLDVEDTEFADQYKETQFGKYRSSYNGRAPMLAGFNLKNIDFGNFFQSDMLFLSVDFRGADFRKTELPYSSFNNCNFVGSDVSNTNFNQCRFEGCNFEGVDLSKTDLCEGSFENCFMYETTYNKKAGLWVYKCFKDNLLTASRDGKLDVVKQLVKIFPALLHSCNQAGNTPLHLAVIKGQSEVVEFLLKNGANIEATNSYSLKPFCESLLRVPPYQNHYSLETFEKIVKLFIEAGLDINGTAKVAKSYLGELAFSGSLEACKILVAHGADINIQDQWGYTPLHNASCGVYKGYFEKQQEEVAQWLVSIGADKKTPTNDGEIALDFAKRFKHDGIVKLLTPSPSYPFFLQNMNVKLKQLTPQKAANALWLSDKDAKTTNASKAEFSLWAKQQELDFNQDDMDVCLSQYTMK